MLGVCSKLNNVQLDVQGFSSSHAIFFLPNSLCHPVLATGILKTMEGKSEVSIAVGPSQWLHAVLLSIEVLNYDHMHWQFTSLQTYPIHLAIPIWMV